MFRIPVDADTPTFDNTFKVSFRRWMTSSATERKEWARRRNSAARLANKNQLARQAKRHRPATPAPPPTTPAAPAMDPNVRAVNRWSRIVMWGLSFELVMYGVAAVLGLVVLVIVVVVIAKG